MEFPMEWVCETLGERKRVAEAVVPALKDKSIEESFFRTLKRVRLVADISDVEYLFFYSCLRSCQSEKSGGTTRKFVPAQN